MRIGRDFLDPLHAVQHLDQPRQVVVERLADHALGAALLEFAQFPVGQRRARAA